MSEIKHLSHYDKIIRKYFVEISILVDELCEYYNDKGYETGAPNFIETVTPDQVLEAVKDWCKESNLGLK